MILPSFYKRTMCASELSSGKSPWRNAAVYEHCSSHTRSIGKTASEFPHYGPLYETSRRRKTCPPGALK